jgi:beta-glucosidase
MRAQLGDRLPTFTEAEFALLREAELDFYAMNYYTSQFARHRTSPASDTDYQGNVDDCSENKDGISIGELSGMFWLRSAPQGFRKHLVRIYKKYGKPIYVTENGCPCPDEDKMSKEESVKDTFRQRYFSDHFDAIVGATLDGAKVDGYFAWSLMDNLGEFPQLYGGKFRPHSSRY